jgi:hypothetical protein
MHRVGRMFGWVLLLCLLMVGTPMTGAAEEKIFARYVAPDGMVITSYSPSWTDQAKLQELHAELLQNEHGEEIQLLSGVEIHDGYPRGKGVAGQYVFTTVGSVFTKQKMQPGRIELYGGSEHKTVADFAHTLAHEYGHHVTHYYTLATDGFSLTDGRKWKDTTYARLRGLSEDDRVGVEGVEHRWQIAEIAAEDYVQLFGSKLAKSVTPFESRAEQALKGLDPAAVSWSGSMYNVQPQENLLLPLASEVPGLYDFFHEKMKGKKGKFTPPAKPTLQLVSYSKQGDVGYLLNFAWSVPNEGPHYHYTLVTYKDEEALAEPVVTRTAKELHEVRYGPVVVRRGQFIYTYEEPNAKGVRNFRLYAFGDNGWVTASPVLTVDMANPSSVEVSDQKVVQMPVEKPAEGVTGGDLLEVPRELQPIWMGLQWVIELVKTVIEWVEALLGKVLG